MKFETINNQLCRMVEPEPLTPEANFPCVVRLIQDDSPMGKYNALKGATMLGMVWLATGQNCYTVHINGMLHDRIFCYEIIGYPVADGSAEWRNYQLMQGKCVCCPGDSEYYQASGQGRIIGRLIENNEFNSTWNSNTFMRDDSDGWHLYEPQPEPKFAVGDWVEFRDIEGIKHGIIEGRREEYSVLCNGVSQSVGDKFITRKLDPSEVIVKIGCLSGTVKPSIYDDGAMLTDEFVLFQDSVKYSTIPLPMLDTPTREMVERLLKAQEEK